MQESARGGAHRFWIEEGDRRHVRRLAASGNIVAPEDVRAAPSSAFSYLLKPSHTFSNLFQVDAAVSHISCLPPAFVPAALPLSPASFSP